MLPQPQLALSLMFKTKVASEVLFGTALKHVCFLTKQNGTKVLLAL